jgi:hypothetical protein
MLRAKKQKRGDKKADKTDIRKETTRRFQRGNIPRRIQLLFEFGTKSD